MKPDCEAIRAARRQKGWTQADLADQSGIALRTVQDCENQRVVDRGWRPRPVTMNSIAGALEVTLAEMVVEENLGLTAEPAGWLLRALDGGKAECERMNHRYVTPHLLLTLLRIAGGAATNCLKQVDPANTLAKALESRLNKVFPPTDEVRFRDFDWSDRRDFRRALAIAVEDGKNKATDKHLFEAVLDGDSTTVRWLQEKLGDAQYEALRAAAKSFPANGDDDGTPFLDATTGG